MCTSPLYRASKELLAFYDDKKPWEFPTALYSKLNNKGYAIIGWREYLDIKQRYALPDWGFVQIPCGKCVECRVKKVKEWSVRCLAEKKTSENAYFVTLTYSDDNLRFETVDGVPYAVLVKDDVQRFFKRLRKRLYGSNGGNLRYFLSGEYGEKSLRPHYHAIIYNLPLDDLRIYKVCGKTVYYISDFLTSVWGLGYVVVGICNEHTTMYTCAYTMKKVGFLQSIEYALQEIIRLAPLGASPDLLKAYISAGVLPRPFSLMSRRKAIGREYFDNNIDEVANGLPSFNVNKLEYYDKVLKSVDLDLWDELKDNRAAVAEASRRRNEARLSLTEKERFLLSEELGEKPVRPKNKL